MASVPFVSEVPSAFAADGDQQFFQSVRGEWSGPGEIVAGKYKGTKFTCSLTGDTPSGTVGMALEGSCRVGLFSQRMSARIERKGRSYKGTFLDGANGEGLDIVSGNVSKSKVVMSLNRNDLNGAMLASMKGDDTMSVTVSVRVNKELVPVIGMNLKRVDSAAVGAIARD
ncbi:MAG: hypothetical protein ACK4U0_18610 [Mesorhizobium sp.]